MPGYKFCPDCKCDLVDELEPESTAVCIVSLKSEKICNRFVDYLSYSGIAAVVEPNEKSGKFDIYCEPADRDRVARAFSVFVSVETGTAIESIRSAKANDEMFVPGESDDDIISLLEDPEAAEDLISEEQADRIQKLLETEEAQPLNELLEEDAVQDLTDKHYNARSFERNEYIPASQKASDAKSTSTMFLVFGFLGIVTLFSLILTHNSPLAPFANFVMLAVFCAMIFVGIWSFVVYKRELDNVEAEETTINLVKKFLAETMSAEAIDAAIAADSENASDDGSEVSRFELDLLREQYISKNLSEKFPTVDNALLLHLAENHYEAMFLNEESEENTEE
ncbi:MAG: hypothetical protein IKX54_03115 [Lachnospiraceae bacterium]|nr:hypothetical protein [Lachnospiraceae bacterium]